MYWNACPSSFVGDELAELVESPGMPLIAMFVSNRDPLSDTCQVFERECLARYGGFLHQGLRDAVVHVLLEAALPARVLSETSLGVLGSNFLQPLAAQMVVTANNVNHRATKGLTLAIGRQIDDAQVNTQRIIRLGLIRSFTALGDVEVVDTLSPHQISAANLPDGINQHLMLARSENETADKPTFEGVQGDVIKAHQAIGAGIIADASARPELWASLTLLDLGRLDGLDRFGSGAAGQLCAQPEVQTRLTIDAVMSCVGIGDVLIPAHARNPRGSGIESTLSGGQDSIMTIHIEFAADCASECIVHIELF